MFKSETGSNLRGCLEAAMASEAAKMALRSNMHTDSRVNKFAGFKSEVKLVL